MQAPGRHGWFKIGTQRCDNRNQCITYLLSVKSYVTNHNTVLCEFYDSVYNCYMRICSHQITKKNKRKQIYDLAWLVFRINKHVQMFVLPGYNAIASLSANGSAAFTCTWKLRYHWLKGLPRCQVLIMRPRPEMVDRIFTVAEAMFTECKITISCGRLTKQFKKDRPIMLTFAWNIIAL